MQPRLIPQAMTVGSVAMMATLSWVALPASGQDREVVPEVSVLHAPDPALAKTGKTVVKRRSPPAKTLAPLDSASVRPGFGRPVIIAGASSGMMNSSGSSPTSWKPASSRTNSAGPSSRDLGFPR